jgi:hypothetical protein
MQSNDAPHSDDRIERRAAQAILSDLGAATPPGTARAYQDATKVSHQLGGNGRVLSGTEEAERTLAMSEARIEALDRLFVRGRNMTR